MLAVGKVSPALAYTCPSGYAWINRASFSGKVYESGLRTDRNMNGVICYRTVNKNNGTVQYHFKDDS